MSPPATSTPVRRSLPFRVHLLLTVGAAFAVGAQVAYRVPGGRVFVVFTLVNAAFVALHVLLLLKAMVWRGAGRTVPEPLWFLERGSALTVLAFLAYSIVLNLNGLLATSIPYVEQSDVVAMSTRSTEFWSGLPHAWADLRSWNASGKIDRVLLVRHEPTIVWGGAPVEVQLRKGYFGIPWIMHIAPDPERRSQQVLRLAPGASLALGQLAYAYLGRHAWHDGKAAAIAYIDANPQDAVLPRHVAETLAAADRYDDVVDVLEHVKRPDYDTEILLGRALARTGRTADAVTHFERARARHPDEPDAYRELGAIRLAAGDVAAAVPLFEKVLELQPRSPDVRAQLRRLRR